MFDTVVTLHTAFLLCASDHFWKNQLVKLLSSSVRGQHDVANSTSLETCGDLAVKRCLNMLNTGPSTYLPLSLIVAAIGITPSGNFALHVDISLRTQPLTPSASSAAELPESARVKIATSAS